MTTLFDSVRDLDAALNKEDWAAAAKSAKPLRDELDMLMNLADEMTTHGETTPGAVETLEELLEALRAALTPEKVHILSLPSRETRVALCSHEDGDLRVPVITVGVV